MTPSIAPDRKWLALALLALAPFVVVLDASIVNVALPSIGRDLHFSQDNLSWVINAYTLTFGGFLLLGGRMADLLGRRRLFIAGLLLFPRPPPVHRRPSPVRGRLARRWSVHHRQPARHSPRGAGPRRRAAVPRRP